MPLAIPAAPTDCLGHPAGDDWAASQPAVVLAGAGCPAAALWLRPDGATGAGAADASGALVDWVSDPATHEVEVPGWQEFLPGKPMSRLAAVNTALNDGWAGKVITLALFDQVRGTGDHRDAHLVAVLPFLLTAAHLDRPDPACGEGKRMTCLVGTFQEAPPSLSPPPTPTPCDLGDGPGGAGPTFTLMPRVAKTPRPSAFRSPHPTTAATPATSRAPAGASGDPVGATDEAPPSPSSATDPSSGANPSSALGSSPATRASTPPGLLNARPKPAHTRPPKPSHKPCPSKSPRPTRTPSPTPSDSPSPSPSGSPSPSPSASDSPSPTASASSTPTPASYLRINVAPTSIIPLARGATGSALLGVQVTSDGAWHLSAAAVPVVGSAQGHMQLAASSTTLAQPMQVVNRSGVKTDLTGPLPVEVYRGTGSVNVPVELSQAVDPGDAPGTYGIQIVISAVIGF